MAGLRSSTAGRYCVRSAERRASRQGGSACASEKTCKAGVPGRAPPPSRSVLCPGLCGSVSFGGWFPGRRRRWSPSIYANSRPTGSSIARSIPRSLRGLSTRSRPSGKHCGRSSRRCSAGASSWGHSSHRTAGLSKKERRPTSASVAARVAAHLPATPGAARCRRRLTRS